MVSQKSGLTNRIGSSSYSDVEVSIFIAGADTEGVVSPWRDAGGLNLKDVRWDGALRCDAHVAVHHGERQIPTGGFVDRTHAAAETGANAVRVAAESNYCKMLVYIMS